MNRRILRPNSKDIDEIRRLFSITVANNFQQEEISDPTGELKENLIIGLMKTLESDFKSNGENEFHLVVKQDNLIIGIIAFGEPNQLILENVKLDALKTPEIKSVYVLPAYQNSGIGNLLLRNIIQHIIQNGFKEFCLDSGYINAQQYWKKKFGNPICTLEKYWTPENHHMIWHVKIEDVNAELKNKPNPKAR